MKKILLGAFSISFLICFAIWLVIDDRSDKKPYEDDYLEKKITYDSLIPPGSVFKSQLIGEGEDQIFKIFYKEHSYIFIRDLSRDEENELIHAPDCDCREVNS